MSSLDRERPTCPTCGSAVTLIDGQTAQVDEQPSIPGFEILGHIGKGGMGTVWAAKQSVLGRKVAIKVLAPRLATSPHFMHRFRREAQTLARLQHPGIVSIHDFIPDKNLCCIIMEYIDGPERQGPVSVHHLIRRRQLTPDLTRRIILDVLDALNYAHGEQVVHRDVKPSNILLDHHRRIKVVDFGIAALHDDQQRQQLTHAGGPLGTLEYMAPEQTEDATDADHRADIYSVGIVLYEMLTGSRPRGAFRLPSHLIEGLDSGWDEVIRQALQPDREDRYQTAAAMIHAIETLGAASDVLNHGRIKPDDADLQTIRTRVNSPEGNPADAPVDGDDPADSDHPAPATPQPPNEPDSAGDASESVLDSEAGLEPGVDLLSPSDSVTIEQVPVDMLAGIGDEGFPMPRSRSDGEPKAGQSNADNAAAAAGESAGEQATGGIDGAEDDGPQTIAALGIGEFEIPDYLARRTEAPEDDESDDEPESSHEDFVESDEDADGDDQPFAPEPVSTVPGASSQADVAPGESPLTADTAPLTEDVPFSFSILPDIPVEDDPELAGEWGLRLDTKPDDQPRPQQVNETAIPFRPFSRPATLLVCLLDDGTEDDGDWFRIRKSRFVIGRKSGDIQLPYDRSLSSRHAEIRLHPIGDGRHDFIIRDLETTNGTFARVSRAVLEDKQQLLLGMRRYEFLKGGKQDGKREPDVLRELTPEGPGKKYPLLRKTITIGRDPLSATIVLLGDPFISPKHARIRYNSKGQWVLKNLHSRNGVWVRVNELTICSGGAFQVGSQRVLVKIP